MTQYGYEEDYWSVDGKVLPQYLDECVLKTNNEYLSNIGGTFDGLCPAWSKDLDFSCTVIVAEVDKTKWNTLSGDIYRGRMGRRII